MALYEAEFTIHPDTPDEECTTRVFEAPKNSVHKTPLGEGPYEWLRVVARDWGHGRAEQVHIRLCLYWPLKFVRDSNVAIIGQTSEIQRYWVRAS